MSDVFKPGYSAMNRLVQKLEKDIGAGFAEFYATENGIVTYDDKATVDELIKAAKKYGYRKVLVKDTKAEFGTSAETGPTGVLDDAKEIWLSEATEEQIAEAMFNKGRGIHGTFRRAKAGFHVKPGGGGFVRVSPSDRKMQRIKNRKYAKTHRGQLKVSRKHYNRIAKAKGLLNSLDTMSMQSIAEALIVVENDLLRAIVEGERELDECIHAMMREIDELAGKEVNQGDRIVIDGQPADIDMVGGVVVLRAADKDAATGLLKFLRQNAKTFKVSFDKKRQEIDLEPT